jgi:hypothetical protein
MSVTDLDRVCAGIVFRFWEWDFYYPNVDGRPPIRIRKPGGLSVR